jgi:hypothetical protein
VSLAVATQMAANPNLLAGLSIIIKGEFHLSEGKAKKAGLMLFNSQDMCNPFPEVSDIDEVVLISPPAMQTFKLQKLPPHLSTAQQGEEFKPVLVAVPKSMVFDHDMDNPPNKSWATAQLAPSVKTWKTAQVCHTMAPSLSFTSTFMGCPSIPSKTFQGTSWTKNVTRKSTLVW